MHATHLVIGGGSGGCVMAARLSEDASNKVILVEAGQNYTPDQIPDDLRDTYSGSALMNPSYFWKNLKVRRRADAAPVYYEQGRVLGGGSSVNGQVALRGAPEDYDHWHAIGAKGWDWNSVLPYFRRLETDLDYTDQLHGAQGPITVRRMPMDQWDDFTLSVTKVWNELGYALRPDMNGEFGEGYSPLPLSNDGSARRSTAAGYLDAATRRRPNLQILGEAQVRRILFADGRAAGAEVRRNGEIETITADTVVVCAGALHTPWLLMLSGIGPGAHLRQHGIDVRLDRPGVGSNLMDHPAIHISGYLPPVSRHKMVLRRNYTYLRWSSGLPDVPAADMVMMAVCRSAWHAIGVRIGTLSSYIGRSYSTGEVRLTSANPDDEPYVDFNWLSDPRDMDRMTDAFRRMARILASDPVPNYLSNLFASRLSQRVRNVSQKNFKNAVLTNVAAVMMDSSTSLRKLLFDKVISDCLPLPELLADAGKLERHVRDNVQSAWHASCTCRMGDPADPRTVVGPDGRVVGADNLFIADASVMPEVSRTNTNIPTIMIAERIAEMVRQRGFA
ncbi:GMC family oxidoreductase [Acidisphaera sp. S103]|uniref:GMC family oxidoreductase n=1 Tax=Acidisphaera sp. S103 TaxID=1747223 RepID=UPI00131E3BAD|nr:GMC family oxidoreductase N-terminal domain-containing protein [Acidisphaera sp. S103]